MRRHLLGISAVFALTLAAACGGGKGTTTTTTATGTGGMGATSSSGTGGSGTSTGGSSTTSTTGTGGTAPAGWTAVSLVDEMVAGNAVSHQDDTVTAIWFKDLTHGVVATYAGSGSPAGSLQSLSSANKIDKVAFTGSGTGFSMQDQSFIAFFPTSAGLVAASTFGDQFITSTDSGLTFHDVERGDSNSGNIPAIWYSKDSSNKWHLVDDVGNVWATSSDPGPGASWSVTWQPAGSSPMPPVLPPGACPNTFSSGYFAFDSQQVFWASPDGKTMMYGQGYGSAPAGVCRSTDGGGTFFPVAFPNPPAASAMDVPYVLIFSDATHGLAARANDLADGAAYIYTTSDAGATWAPSTVPATVNAAGEAAYFSSGFYAPDGQHVWLVGSTIKSDALALLLKSSDGGKTWKDVSSKLAPNPAAAAKFHTGFALDANNIWIGGEHGKLLHSNNGGE